MPSATDDGLKRSASKTLRTTPTETAFPPNTARIRAGTACAFRPHTAESIRNLSKSFTSRSCPHRRSNGARRPSRTWRAFSKPRRPVRNALRTDRPAVGSGSPSPRPAWERNRSEPTRSRASRSFRPEMPPTGGFPCSNWRRWQPRRPEWSSESIRTDYISKAAQARKDTLPTPSSRRPRVFAKPLTANAPPTALRTTAPACGRSLRRAALDGPKARLRNLCPRTNGRDCC